MMNRRSFLKLPVAGALLLPAAEVAARLALPESDLKIVEAWAAPPPRSPLEFQRLELLHTFDERVVSLLNYDGRLYVATEHGVYVVPAA